MANYATLKAAIAAAIKENGNNEITGNLLQQQLLAMVNSLGVGYQYAGIANPDTNPGTPDQNVFYLALTAGTYANFGGWVLANGEIAILKYNGAWSKDSTGAASSLMVDFISRKTGAGKIELTFTGNYQFSDNVGIVPAGSIISSIGGLSEINLYQTNDAYAEYENIKAVNLPYTVQHDSYYFRSLTEQGTFVISFADSANAPDLTPTLGSQKSVTSDGIKKALNNLESNLEGLFLGLPFVRRSVEFTQQYQFQQVEKIPIGSVVISLGGASELNFYTTNGSSDPYTAVFGENLPYVLDREVNYIRAKTETGTFILQIALPQMDNYIVKRNNPLKGNEIFTQVGFIRPNGQDVDTNTYYRKTDYLPILPNQTITTRYVNYYNQYHDVSAIVFYTKEKVFISQYNDISNDESEIISFGADTQYPIPSNAYYFRCVTQLGNVQRAYIDVYSQKSLIEQVAENSNEIKNKRSKKYLSAKAASLNDGDSISFGTPTNCSGVLLSFHAKIIQFGNVVIQHGTTAWTTGKIMIDSTNLYVYKINEPDVVAHTYPHNLNINTFINVEIEETLNDGKITITTLGGEFVQDNSGWSGCGTIAQAKNNGGVLADCQLTFGNPLWIKETWIFGDSYMSFWPQQIVSRGFSNCLFDGFPGAGTSNGLASFKECIKRYIPRRVIWALGMNNADSDSAINSTWKTNTESVMALCSLYNIELILVTIPNVPERNHTFKNQFIRESGYRYVDINEAVGADISTAWYSGLLGGDNVHPTTTGAIVIGKRFMADVPELKM